MDGHIHYCTDAHRPYKAIIKAEQHTVGKAHTHHIESLNNKLRWYLARLGEKMHAYSKSATALLHSLLFALMARSNSPTLGHPKFPQAGPPDHDDSVRR